MWLKSRVLLGLSVLALTGPKVVAASPLAPLTHWLPTNTLLVLEVVRPKVLLEPVLDARVAEAVTARPIYQALASGPKFKEFCGLVKLLEGVAGTNWQSAVQTVTGGGLTLAVLAPNRVVLSIDAEDERMLARLHEFLKGIAQLEASKAGQPNRVAATNQADVTTWTFDGRERHCLLGNRLLVGSTAEALETVLWLRRAAPAPTLESTRTYRAAKQAVGTNAAARLLVNLAVLKRAPALAPLFNGPRKNPLAALLFTSVLEALQNSDWVAADLNVNHGKLSLRAMLDGKKTDSGSLAGFAKPVEGEAGTLPNLKVPRQIAGLSFYRDLHRFYAAKDQLFPDRTSGLIFFENMMGIFFSGRDLTDDVLAQPQPEIRFVVAEQKFDPALGTPEVQLPAFAVVLRLRHAKAFGEVIEEAWQKALGLINFTRGQQALPGLIIDRPNYQGTTFTSAHYSTADIKDHAKLDQRFNVRPALAMPGDYLILSSTELLARDLIDSVKREEASALKPAVGTDSLVELDGGQLASILEANRSSLIRQNMVKSGKTLEAAQTEAATLVALAKSVSHLKLSLGNSSQQVEARLEANVDWP